ncbi:hypothetical protein ACWF9G_22965 [Nocardia sp. NPDC055029]
MIISIIGGIAARNFLSASAFGIYDLCGGVWEWTDSPGTAADRRELKGGAFSTMLDDDTGFRCATVTLAI